jgi:hypothetical protein
MTQTVEPVATHGWLTSTALPDLAGATLARLNNSLAQKSKTKSKT